MNDEKTTKKRGRKPKGGKIIKNVSIDTNKPIIKKSIILHLKCFKKDIKYNDYDATVYEVEPFIKENNYEKVNYNINNTKVKPINEDNATNNNDKINNEINIKLNELEKSLHLNNITKKSDCFWCTCSFDTHSIHIPSYLKQNKYHVYGNFCSPECACSYLFEEKIDDSIKYERYQLLNYIYGKIYNYSKSIKLAPSPFYILEKFYGNLSINEYRKLLVYDRLLIITDKPLTKIYPELHQDNADFEPIYNNKITMRQKINVDKNSKIKNVFQL